MMKISPQEWKFIGFVWLIVVFLTFLPIVIGMIATPQGSIFWGGQNSIRLDIPVYYSNIEQAKDGHFLFKNLFTSEPHPRFIFDPFWLGVGILAKIFSLSSFLAFQLAKFLLIPVLLIVSYYFTALFFQEEVKRKVCFVFLIFASGLGWLYFSGRSGDTLTFFQDPPIDFFPETFTLYTIYSSPHFIASLTLIILIFLFSLLAFENYKLIYSLGAGLSALFLFQFHPYRLPTILGVLGVCIAFLFLKEKRLNFNYLKHYFILLFFSLPPIFYYFWTIQNFSVQKGHFLQNITLTPSLPMVFIGYGFLIVLALVGFFLILKKRDKNIRDIFLISWFPTQFLLIYSPFLFRQKLSAGLHVVMSVLATIALFHFKNLVEKKPFFQKYFKDVFSSKIFLIWLFFILFFSSNASMLINDIFFYTSNDNNLHLQKEVKEAMIWLKENSGEESVILSVYETGNLIPAFSLRQVYLGHFHQTIQFEKKMGEVEQFFQKTNDDEKIDFLKENKIDYLFFGPEEKKESQFNPEEKNYFKKVFSNNQATIYKINY